MDSENRDPELNTIRAKKLKEIMTRMEPSEKPVVLTDDDFEQFVKDAPMAIIDFWATWCRPCQMVAPILEKLAKEEAGKVWIGKIDVDKNGATAQRYGATSIPTFWAFKEGKPVGRFVGAHPEPSFRDVIKQLKDLDMSTLEDN